MSARQCLFITRNTEGAFIKVIEVPLFDGLPPIVRIETGSAQARFNPLLPQSKTGYRFTLTTIRSFKRTGFNLYVEQ